MMEKIDNSLMVECPKCGHFFNEKEAKPLKGKDRFKGKYKEANEFYGYCPHCGGTLSLAQLVSVKDYFEGFEEDNPNWKEHLTDSTYHEIADWFAEDKRYEFDDEKGYPEQVEEFVTCVWKEICPQAYDTTEYVRVPKDFIEELISFVKDTAFEGNSFAEQLIKKYDLK